MTRKSVGSLTVRAARGVSPGWESAPRDRRGRPARRADCNTTAPGASTRTAGGGRICYGAPRQGRRFAPIQLSTASYLGAEERGWSRYSLSPQEPHLEYGPVDEKIMNSPPPFAFQLFR